MSDLPDQDISYDMWNTIKDQISPTGVPGWKHAQILPIAQDPQGNVHFPAMPGMIQSIVRGFSAPGDVLSGARDAGEAVPDATAAMGLFAAPALSAPYEESLASAFPAWHGTQHTFEPVEGNPFGEFKDSAIGSGEGAQAYGMGHYFAGAENIAKGYQKRLAGQTSIPVDDNGIPLNDDELVNKYFEPGQIIPRNGRYVQVKSLESEGDYGPTAMVQRVQPKDDAANPKDILGDPSQWYIFQGNNPYEIGAHVGDVRPWEISNVGQARGWKLQNPGNTYQIEAKPELSDLLDWDTSIGKQSQGVQDKVLQVAKENGMTGPDDPMSYGSHGMTGEHFYRTLSDYSTGGDTRASQLLNEAGVPGHRFLDSNSRDLLSKNDIQSNIDMYQRMQTQSDPANPANVQARMSALGMPDDAAITAQMQSQYTKAQNTSTHPALTPGERQYAADRMAGYNSDDPAAFAAYKQNEQRSVAAYLQTQHNIATRELSTQQNALANFREPTHNYVIYDPSNISITHRNGASLEPVPNNPFQPSGSQ